MIRGFCRSALALLVATLGLGAYVGDLQLSGNVHSVVAGEIYRSAQLSTAQLTAYASRYRLRTIVNLRGANPGRPWYDREVAASAHLGVARLLAILNAADKPLLIHCQSGADRSGLVAGLYLAAIARHGEAAAEDQLSIRYGHIGLPHVASAYAMDRTWETLESGLGFSGS